MVMGLTIKHDRLQMAMLADIAGTCVLHRSPGSGLVLDLCVEMEAAIPKGLGRLSNAGDRRRQCLHAEYEPGTDFPPDEDRGP